MNKKLIIFGIAVLLIVIGLSGCSERRGIKYDYNRNSDKPKDISNYHDIVLEVKGSADSVYLSYTYGDKSVSYDNVDLPWSYDTFLAEKGEFYYVYAQNNDKYGWIEATITIDGILVETDTSYSSYGVVSVGDIV